MICSIAEAWHGHCFKYAEDDAIFANGAYGDDDMIPHNGLVDEVFVFSVALSETKTNKIRSNGLEGER